MITNLLLSFITAIAPVQDTPTPEKWADSARVAIEAAFAAGRAEGVADGRRVAERGLERHPKDALLLHYQGYGFYREGLLRDGDAARGLQELAREALERSIAVRDLAESRAVLSAVFGNLIAGSAWRAVRFGRSASRAIDQALDLGPNNPRVWLLKGAGALYAPGIAGGGADKAEVALRKAIALYATDLPAASMPAWGLAEAHGWLALTLMKLNRAGEARSALAEGLKLSPGHAFLVERVQPVLK